MTKEQKIQQVQRSLKAINSLFLIEMKQIDSLHKAGKQ